MRLSRALVASLALFCTACADAPRSNDLLAVRDSAGVRLVEIAGSLTAGPSRISVSRRPAWQTGWADGEPTFEWVVSGFLLPDGGAVVGDATSGRIYVLSADGQVVRELGGKGDGPGEFRGLFGLASLPPDTIIASDRQRGRAFLFTLEGQVGRSIGLPRVMPFAHAVTRVIGDTLMYSFQSWAPGYGDRTPGWRTIEAPLMVSGRVGEPFDTIGLLPFTKELWREGRPAPLPFPPHGPLDTYGRGFVWAMSDSPEVRWFDTRGRVVQIARWAPEWVEITDEVWNEYREAQLSSLADSPEMRGREDRLREILEEQKQLHDGRLPLFGWLHAGSDGSVWLPDFKMGVGLGPRFTVLGGDGSPLGVVELPKDFRVLDIADSWILGVWRDELDIESVAVFRYEVKGQPGS